MSVKRINQHHLSAFVPGSCTDDPFVGVDDSGRLFVVGGPALTGMNARQARSLAWQLNWFAEREAYGDHMLERVT